MTGPSVDIWDAPTAWMSRKKVLRQQLNAAKIRSYTQGFMAGMVAAMVDHARRAWPKCCSAIFPQTLWMVWIIDAKTEVIDEAEMVKFVIFRDPLSYINDRASQGHVTWLQFR